MIRIYHLPVFLLVLMFTAKNLNAQKIHWADHLIFQHNQYSETEYSGKEILGPPNAQPYGKLSKHAFRLNDQQAYGTVSVGYKEPIHVSQIIIIENFLPNHVEKVILKDTEGNEHLIHEPRNIPSTLPARVLNINIEKTPYKVEAVTIHLNTYENNGWAQIDAIGILGIQHREMELAALIDTQNFDYNEIIRFAGMKEKLGKNINSSCGEARPVISPDGRTLYFVRKFNSHNIGGKTDDQDIYYSNFINGRWTIAQNIGWPLNDQYPNGICSISPDGNTIWVLNSYNLESGIIEDGISVSHKSEDGRWSQPTGLKIENFHNKNDFQDYSVSASGQILLMAIETDESVGEQDIYVSFKKDDDTWTEPQNLGHVINTEYVEYSPTLSADERILFFTSNGHSKSVNGDIYYSQRLDDSWLNWTVPNNIGLEVNTPGLDSYFSMSPNNEYAYFVSSENVDQDEEFEISDLDVYRIPVNIEPVPGKIISLSGKIYDRTNNKSIYANITLEASKGVGYQGFTASNVKTGDYTLKISKEANYLINVESEGYLTYSDSVYLSNEEDLNNLVFHVAMEPVTKGHVFSLNQLYFNQSSANLLPESKQELEKMYRLMVNNETLKIKLGGHTDNQGYKSANTKLSKVRAETVRDYLVGKGIDKKRIKAVGYGSSQPIVPNDSKENRARNRRVEVEILDI